MINGKCPTWFVVKWLSKKPEHYARAPKTGMLPKSRIRSVGSSVLAFEYWLDGDWLDDTRPDQRSDWTIYTERGVLVEFKPKVANTRTGLTLTPGCTVRVYSSDGKFLLGAQRFSSHCDVFVREHRAVDSEYDPRGIPISVIPTYVGWTKKPL